MTIKQTLIFAKDLFVIVREKVYFCLKKKEFFLSPIPITPRWKFVPILKAWEKFILLQFKWFKAFFWLRLYFSFHVLESYVLQPYLL